MAPWSWVLLVEANRLERFEEIWFFGNRNSKEECDAFCFLFSFIASNEHFFKDNWHWMPLCLLDFCLIDFFPSPSCPFRGESLWSVPIFTFHLLSFLPCSTPSSHALPSSPACRAGLGTHGAQCVLLPCAVPVGLLLYVPVQFEHYVVPASSELNC